MTAGGAHRSGRARSRETLAAARGPQPSGMGSLAVNSALYIGMLLVQKAVGFFLLPLYTSQLSPSDYGIVAFVQSAQALLVIFFSLGLRAAVTRFYYQYRTDVSYVRRVWGTVFIFTTLSSVAISLLIGLTNRWTVRPFAGEIPFYPYVLLGLVSISFNTPYSIYQASLQARQAGRSYTLNSVLFFLLNLAATLVCLFGFGMKADGVLLASAITNVVFFVVTLLQFGAQISARLEGPVLRECLLYSLPLLPHMLSAWAMGLLSNLFLNVLKDPAQVGLYNVGFQFGSIITLLATGINQAFTPWFMDNETTEAGRRRIASFTEIAASLYALIACVVSLLGPELLRVMTSPAYAEAWSGIPLMCLAALFTGLYFLTINSFFVRKTIVVPMITGLGAIASVVLSLLLVPTRGFVGAGIASAASRLITFLLTMAASALLLERHHRIPFPWLRVSLIALAATAASAAVYLGLSFPVRLVGSLTLAAGALLLYRRRIVELVVSLRRRVKHRTGHGPLDRLGDGL